MTEAEETHIGNLLDEVILANLPSLARDLDIQITKDPNHPQPKVTFPKAYYNQIDIKHKEMILNSDRKT